MRLHALIFLMVSFVLVVVVPVRAADCSDEQTIMRLFVSDNSHVSSALDSNAPYRICYDTIFGAPYVPAGRIPQQCAGDLSNRIIGISAQANAHAENPFKNPQTSGYSYLCYGDLSCRFVNTAAGERCNQAGEKVIVSLGADTNAHVSDSDFASYQYKICCKKASSPPAPSGEIVSVLWQNPLTGASLDNAKSGDTVNLVALTRNYPVGAIIEFSIYENDDGDLSFGLGDERIKASILASVGDDRTAKYSWTITSDDVERGYNSEFRDSGQVEFVFDATDGILKKTSTELNVPRGGDQTTEYRWECTADFTGANQVSVENGEINQTLITLYSSSLSAEQKKVAGEACKGPNGATGTVINGASTSADDCCPTGYACTANQGCVLKSVTPDPHCKDYGSNRVDCEKDSLNFWRLTPSFIQKDKDNECVERTLANRCVFNTVANRCEFGVVELNKRTNAVEATCSSFYNDPAPAECPEGSYKTVTVTYKQTGDLKCMLPKDCDASKTYDIPCGRPQFELPFFGFWQVIGAVIIIALLYFIMFKNAKFKRFLHIR